MNSIKRPLPDWSIPVAFIGAFALIAVALWAVGNGVGPDDYASEVQSARHLLIELGQRETSQDNTVQDAMRVSERQEECENGESIIEGSASYCANVAEAEAELNRTAIEIGGSQIDKIEAALHSLDPAAVEEAER